DVLLVRRELDLAHLADRHAAVLERRLTDPQAGAVAEGDGDLGTDRAQVLEDEPSGDPQRHHRHHPHQAEQAGAADSRLGQLFAGHFCSQMSFGSKAAEANRVNTTIAVKATRPVPGTTVASWP